MRDTHWPGRASGPPGGTKSHLPGGLGQELTMLARAPPPAPGPLRNLLRLLGVQAWESQARGPGESCCHPTKLTVRRPKAKATPGVTQDLPRAISRLFREFVSFWAFVHSLCFARWFEVFGYNPLMSARRGP